MSSEISGLAEEQKTFVYKFGMGMLGKEADNKSTDIIPTLVVTAPSVVPSGTTLKVPFPPTSLPSNTSSVNDLRAAKAARLGSPSQDGDSTFSRSCGTDHSDDHTMTIRLPELSHSQSASLHPHVQDNQPPVPAHPDVGFGSLPIQAPPPPMHMPAYKPSTTASRSTAPQISLLEYLSYHYGRPITYDMLETLPGLPIPIPNKAITPWSARRPRRPESPTEARRKIDTLHAHALLCAALGPDGEMEAKRMKEGFRNGSMKIQIVARADAETVAPLQANTRASSGKAEMADVKATENHLEVDEYSQEGSEDGEGESDDEFSSDEEWEDAEEEFETLEYEKVIQFD